MLANFIEKNPEIVRGKRVIELGSGPGLVSLTCALAACSKLLCTDGDVKSVKLARLNLVENLKSVPTKTNWSAQKLRWG